VDDRRYATRDHLLNGRSATLTGRPVNDLVADWELLEKLFAPPSATTHRWYARSGQALASWGLGIGGASLASRPGFGLFQGGMMDMSVCTTSSTTGSSGLRELHERQSIAEMEMVLEERPDSSSLEARARSRCNRRASRATSRSRRAKEAHAHGAPGRVLTWCTPAAKSVTWCAGAPKRSGPELHQPARSAPHGRLQSGDIKLRYGGRLSLMGNLHTDRGMLRGRRTTWSARRAARLTQRPPVAVHPLTGDQCRPRYGRKRTFRWSSGQNLRALLSTPSPFRKPACSLVSPGSAWRGLSEGTGS